MVCWRCVNDMSMDCVRVAVTGCDADGALGAERYRRAVGSTASDLEVLDVLTLAVLTAALVFLSVLEANGGRQRGNRDRARDRFPALVSDVHGAVIAQ